ncbi:MAG TPA: class IV adenylate cyclase [Pirellulales bacterium]|jgi:adenylate cyclase class 2|nr:class IV adenylate cyclase [Pirellulales bacterium]
MSYEVEIKFPVSEFPSLEQLFDGKPPQIGAPQLQVDTYYAHPARDFARTDEALRIRHIGDENRLTYKGPKVDAATKTRREIELSLPAGEHGANQMAELLEALGFRAAATVSKHRRRATFDWQGHRVEAAFDEVEGLGRFVELETSADDDRSLDAARRCLMSLAEASALAHSERRSYLELLLAAHGMV